MKYRTLRRKALKEISSGDSELKKYNVLRGIFAKMFSQKTPFVLETNKERLTKAVPTIKKIYEDPEAPYLFKNMIPSGDFNKTYDFVIFLSRIIKDEES